MVPGVGGDGGGGVEGLHEGEVVAAHVGETLGVLVHEGSLGDGVGAGEVAGQQQVSAIGRGGAHSGGLGGVVGPVRLDGGVLHSEKEHLNGVREADVVAGSGGRGVGLGRGGLHLLNEDVAGSAGHALTLVVGHDGVVGPHLHVAELGAAVVGQIGSHSGTAGLVDGGAATHGGLHIPSGEQVEHVAEGEVQAHVVVGKSGGGESHTGVAGVEERQGQVEDLGGQGQGRVDQVAGGADHVGITHLLGTGHGESSPEIQQEVVETSSHKVVESDAGLAHKVVGKVGGPGQESLDGVVGVARVGGGLGGRNNLGKGEPKPSVQQVVASAANAHTPLLAKARLARGPGQNDRHLCEPSSLAGLPHKVGGRIRTTVHILLQLVIGGKIDKSRCEIARTYGSHFLGLFFIGVKKKKFLFFFLTFGLKRILIE